MRDHSDAFEPTVPDDVEEYVPAPGDPSGERPEYKGEPNYRGSNDRPPREGGDEFDDAMFGTLEPAEPGEDNTPPDASGDTGGALEKPPTTGKGSGKDAWVAYAKSLGHTDEQLADLSYEQLVEMFTNT